MKSILKAGDKLIQDLAHDILINKGVNWSEIFDSVEELNRVVPSFGITPENLPHIMANFSTDAKVDYELDDLEARFICRLFLGNPRLEEFIGSTGDANVDKIYLAIISDFLECNNHLNESLEQFIEVRPWGVWQVESYFYSCAPNAVLKTVGLSRKDYVKKCVLDTYNKGVGKRKFVYVEAPKPFTIF